MGDGESESRDLVQRIAEARRRVSDLTDELEDAKDAVEMTPEAQRVGTLKLRLKFAKKRFSAIVYETDAYYQPELMDMPGATTTTFSDGERSVTLTGEQLSRAAALTGEELSRLLHDTKP